MMIRDGGEGSSGGRWESKRAAAETDGAMEFARRPYVGLHWWACASSLLLFHHGHGETKWTRLKKNLSTKKRLKFLLKKKTEERKHCPDYRKHAIQDYHRLSPGQSKTDYVYQSKNSICNLPPFCDINKGQNRSSCSFMLYRCQPHYHISTTLVKEI